MRVKIVRQFSTHFLTVALVLAGGNLQARESKSTPHPNSYRPSISTAELMKLSQISYRAEGGFTGVESYGVIISCVEGKISILKSIGDPRLGTGSALRQVSTMPAEEYENLWKELARLSVMNTPDAPLPIMDIEDEFTLSFDARLGSEKHQFKVYGLSRPEASRHFAVRSVIDRAVGMDDLWQTHAAMASSFAANPTIPAAE